MGCLRLCLVLSWAAGLVQAAAFHDLGLFQSLTATTLIDFDNSPAGPITEWQSFEGVYTSIGVDFRFASYAGVAVGPVSGALAWFDDDFDLLPFFPAWFNSSAGPVTAVGVHHVLLSGPVARLTAFDAVGDPLGSVDSDSDLNTADFFGLTTAAPIARIEIVWQDSYAGWGLDDLYFGRSGPATVPEPSTFALAAAGLAFAAWRRRR